MRTLRAGAVVAIVLALVLSPSLAFAADPPDFTPSGNKFREWALNVTSKVLGGAMPNSWRAEQLANEYRYNYSWEGLRAQFGQDPANPNYTAAPDSYDDYMLKKADQSLKGGKGGKPFRAPATKPASLARVGAGALGVMTSFQFGTMLGTAGTNLVGGWIGYDADAVVCTSYGDDFGGMMAQLITGRDCSPWRSPAEYLRNGDAGVLISGMAGPYRYIGSVRPVQWPAANWWMSLCYSKTGDTPSGHRIEQRLKNGTWVQGVPSGPSTSASNICYAGLGAQYVLYGQDGQGTNDATRATGVLRMVRNSDSAVIETMSTAPNDPSRTLSCRITMTDSTSVTASSATYKESSGAVAPLRCPAIPAGKTPAKVDVTAKGDGVPDAKVYDQPTTPEYQEWAQDFPECGTGACKLDLVKVAPVPTSCFSAALADGCPGWWEDPSKADNYDCRYGIHEVDIEECAVYAGLFQPGRVTGGAPYTDPKTGTWSGGQTSPQAGQSAMTRTIQDPESVRNCDLSDIGFDPIGWVVRPGQCLAEWIAIPRPAVAAVAFGSVQDVWLTKPPGALAAAVDTVTLSGTVSGCSVSTTYKGNAAPLVDACSGPLAVVASFTRLASLAVMAVLVFAKVRRQVGAMVNYNVGQD